MSSRARTTIIVVVALALAVASRFIFPVSTPHVSVKAEPLFGEGSAFPFTNSLLMTLVVDVVLIVLALAATSRLQLVPRGIQNFVEFVIESLLNLFRGINREYASRVFPFVATIFLFVLLSNWLALIPGVGSIGACHHEEEASVSADMRLASRAPTVWLDAVRAQEPPEAHGDNGLRGCAEGDVLYPFLRSPSADLNNTLALAVAAFLYIEYWGFKALGVGYLGKFFNLREGAIMFIVGIFELISEFIRIVAFTFRLFGNVFAGEVILLVIPFLVPFFVPLPFYALEVFVGFIQAFVFAVLTMAFIGLAVAGHGDSHGEAHH